MDCFVWTRKEKEEEKNRKQSIVSSMSPPGWEIFRCNRRLWPIQHVISMSMNWSCCSSDSFIGIKHIVRSLIAKPLNNPSFSKMIRAICILNAALTVQSRRQNLLNLPFAPFVNRLLVMRFAYRTQHTDRLLDRFKSIAQCHFLFHQFFICDYSIALFRLRNI